MISKEYSKEDKKNKAIIICGPTGSGKTTLSIKIAKKYKGSVIGADSRQIYKKLDIGTAKPTKEEIKTVPHYLIDFVDITDDFTAADFAKMAFDCAEEITKSKRVPIIAGGSGLYIEAFAKGLTEFPSKDKKIRSELEQKAKEFGSSFLYEELKKKDPDSAKNIYPNDSVRIIRALEIFELSGSQASLIKKSKTKKKSNIDFLWIALDYPREILYSRINQRVDLMVKEGLIDEVKKLIEEGFLREIKFKKIVGYSEIINALEGELAMDQAIDLIKQHTRNYAKRQLTWFRNRTPSIWLNPLSLNFESEVFALVDKHLK